MALARCEQCGQPQGRKGNVYVARHQPVGHPNSGVVCGTAKCEGAGLVWLLVEEEEQYKKGQRVFEVPNAGVKLGVKLRVQ